MPQKMNERIPPIGEIRNKTAFKPNKTIYKTHKILPRDWRSKTSSCGLGLDNLL